MKERIVIFNGHPATSDIRFSMGTRMSTAGVKFIARCSTLADVSKVVTAAVAFPATAGELSNVLSRP